MADKAMVEETSELVLSALADANPAVKYTVMRRLLADLNFNSFERATVVPDDDRDADDDEAESQLRWECPHCLREFRHNQFNAVDVDVRVTEPTENDEPDDTTQMMCICGADTNYEDLAILCPNCKLPLNVPTGWDTEWC